jgi:hypothetical protein
MLFPSAPGGTRFDLGSRDPSRTAEVVIEKGLVPTAANEGGVHFWSTPTYDLAYASGGTGKTGRWHMHASGGSQLYTWLTQHGFLATAGDLRNQEFTVYVRAHQLFDLTRAAATLKIRGGAHTSSDGNLASCVMMELCPAGSNHPVRFGKELVHPQYDYVTLTPGTSATLVDGSWVGLKMVSYTLPQDATRVINRLYVDAAPFDASGRPVNAWQLLGEYVDVQGTSTGQYSRLADWGGWQTTFRVDGMLAYDIAIFSVREIIPPR